MDMGDVLNSVTGCTSDRSYVCARRPTAACSWRSPERTMTLGTYCGVLATRERRCTAGAHLHHLKQALALVAVRAP
jgi:hypothetical protein